MTVDTDAEVITGTVVSLPPELALVRETYGRFRIATIEFARACQAASDKGRSQREIASAAGCSQKLVSFATQALTLAIADAASRGEHGEDNVLSPYDSDREYDPSPDDYDAAMREIRKPKARDDPPPRGSYVPPDDAQLDIRPAAAPAREEPRGVDPLKPMKAWTEAMQWLKWWRNNGMPEGLAPCFSDLHELASEIAKDYKHGAR